MSGNEDYGTPEQSRSELLTGRSRRNSLGSSRYSGRASRRSSVRDDGQTLDEFLRKQRVIRYMQEERERAARSKILREEHDGWIEFRAYERSERLKYMTEQEIAELLQREAEEAEHDKSVSDLAMRRASEDSVRRRLGVADLRRKGEEAIVARRQSHQDAGEAPRTADRESAAKAEALAVAENARRLADDARAQEEKLRKENEELQRQLAQERGARRTAETNNQGSANDLRQQLDHLQGRLADQEKELVNYKNEKNAALSAVNQRQKEIDDLRRQLEALSVEKGASKSLAVAKDEAKQRALQDGNAASSQLKDAQRALKQEQGRVAQLQKDLAAKDAELKEAGKKGKNADTAAQNKDNKAQAAVEEAKRAQGELAREKAAREKAEGETQRLRDALQKEKDANARAPKEYDSFRSGADGERKRAEELQRQLRDVERVKKADEEQLQRLRNALQKSQDMLREEREARARFEDLAAQAVRCQSPNDELERLRRELGETRSQLAKALRHNQQLCENHERELEALKAYCARLKEHGSVPHTPREGTVPHKTPRSIRKAAPGEGAVRRPVLQVKEAPSAAEVEKLHQEILRLQEQLRLAEKKNTTAGEKTKNRGN
ncbi:hypothetical protein STCU_08101, partial [Strigomonas culicis]